METVELLSCDQHFGVFKMGNPVILCSCSFSYYYFRSVAIKSQFIFFLSTYLFLLKKKKKTLVTTFPKMQSATSLN